VDESPPLEEPAVLSREPDRAGVARVEQRSWLTLPVSTISMTGSAAASVTRRPSTNSLRSPSRSSVRLISSAPPWITTGFSPTRLRSVTSSANASFRLSFTIAAPPYLMTAIWPEKAEMYLSASTSSVRLKAGL